MKDIKDYEGLYGISSCGRVWSYRSKRFLKPAKDRYGYLIVSLYKDKTRKNVKVHRLVAEAYIPNPNNLPQVDHIDNNKEHNYVGNLQWMTNKDNTTKEQGKKINCVELNLDFSSISAAAKYFGCSHSNISNCLTGRAKTACGFHWEFIGDDN